MECQRAKKHGNFSSLPAKRCANKAYVVRTINLCWESIHLVSWLLNYFRNYSTRKHSHRKKQRNKVTKRFLITISDLQLKQIAIQEVHNIHFLFCLVVLAVEKSRKFLLLVTYRNQVVLQKKMIKQNNSTHFSLIWHELKKSRII